MNDLDQVRRAGERLTRQRRAVLQALDACGGHVTAERLCEMLRGEFPNLNTGTVYRVLQWLKDRGLICETDIGIGAKVYERVYRPCHHHLICLRCHRTYKVDDRYFRPLAAALRQDLGFQTRIDHFAVFGYCADCVEQESQRASRRETEEERSS